MKNALLSVTDKRGLAELARALSAAGWSLFATGGTKKHLEGGVPCESVESVTDFPEIMEGRVKTLHPKIFAGILARRNNPNDLAEAKKHGVILFDLVVVNLYEFSQHTDKPIAEQVAHVDIGGSSLIRAASKNWESVCVATDPNDYPALIREIQRGALKPQTRKAMAVKAFQLTSGYDALIAKSWGESSESASAKAWPLRYGENPHQAGSFNITEHATWRVLQGKELSYNNLVDADAAYRLVNDFKAPVVAIIKHTNPCGVASKETDTANIAQLFKEALACDPQSAFGGIVALNRPLDAAVALEMKNIFLEVIIAPGFSEESKSILETKKNLRLIEWPSPAWPVVELRSAMAGLLTQSSDDSLGWDQPKVVTTTNVPAGKWDDLRFAWTVVKHAKSNAIVVAQDGITLGVGAGQMSRVESVELALKKSASKRQRAVLASDAFFPFRDNIDKLKDSGVCAIVQPGGSQRDSEVIAACDELGIAMVFTGIRHFKH